MRSRRMAATLSYRKAQRRSASVPISVRATSPPFAACIRKIVGMAAPGTHALIVGVSDYEYLPTPGILGEPRTFGLKKLASPALSAYKIFDWLMKNHADLPKPLASARLLVSPSQAEKDAEPALK